MNALVSIVVISYNAEAYVEETLNSIFHQSYPKIELIISDDASTDQTVALCNHWLQQHAHRFERTLCITSDQNTGTSRNANRGMKEARGSWLKIIAADDLFMKDGIERLMEFTKSNSNIKACCSSIIPFTSVWSNDNLNQVKNYSKEFFFAPQHNARTQFLISLFKYTIPSPTFFIQHDLFKQIGGYDNEMRIIEDMPLYFRVMLAGEKIYYFNEPTVYYREHPTSASKSKNQQLEIWKQEDRKKRLVNYIQPNVSAFTYYWHRLLMRYFFKQDPISVWMKQTITRFAFLFIKLHIVR